MKKLLFTLAIVAMALCSDAQFTNTNVLSSAAIMYHNQNNPNLPEAYIRAFDNGNTKYPRIRMGRAGGTLLSPGVITNDEILAQFVFQGYYSGWRNGAVISATIDAAIGGSAEMPARLDFATTPDGSVTALTRMTIKEDGDVGIGTETPAAQFVVNENAIFNASGGNYDFVIESNLDGVAFVVDSEPSGDETVSINGFANSTTNFQFSDKVLWGDAGTQRIGIHTNSPNARLDVRGDAIFNEDGADYDFRIEGDGDDYLFFADAGQDFVGIGTIPTEKLHVAGRLRVTSLAPAGSDIFMDASGVFSSGSDERLKKDIEPLENVLPKVLKLQGRTYNWKETNNPNPNTKDIGFIAQEVEELFPEVVPTMSGLGGMKSVNYSRFAAILTEAIKEMHQIIEEEKKEVETLRAEIEELKELMASNQTMNSSSVILENPQGIILNQNDPNPFREMTTIGYIVPETVSSASIIIYDFNGRLIKEVTVQTGAGQLEVYASDLSTGIYTYSIVADGKVIDSKKMMVTK